VPQATHVGDFIRQMDGDPRFLVLRSAAQVGNIIKEGTVFEFEGMCYVSAYIKDEHHGTISGTFVLQ
jgi:hypothetical protein